MVEQFLLLSDLLVDLLHLIVYLLYIDLICLSHDDLERLRR